MPIILRDLPFFIAPTTAVFEGRYVPVKADQIILWVGLTKCGKTDFDPATPLFPTVLDPGYSHNFAIREEHLVRWAGLDPRYLGKKGEVLIGGDRLSVYGAEVWLKPNIPGKRDVSADRMPFCLEIDKGVAVYPKDMPHAPRLPLLGLRALRRANLHLTIDGRRRLVTLRTPRRFWLF
jgi:hypothetical protein